MVTSPADYAAIVDELRASGGSLSPETHWRLAKKAFATTAAYDRAVSAAAGRNSADGRAAAGDARYSRAAHAGAALRRKSASIGRAVRDRQTRESPEPSSFTARSFPTTTWWIWMPPGS